MFSNHYVNWRETRIDTTLKYVGENFFKNKKLLELGCGFGDIGMYFAKNYACQVTCSDGRVSHVKRVNEKIIENGLEKNVNALVYDCDKILSLTERYDILIHWGLLYHLKNVKEHLNDILKCADYILLETEVCDSSDDICKYIGESGYDQALNSVGSRPSATYVENILKDNNFEYKMIKDSSLNSSFHTYDWESKDNESFRSGLRRFWICWRKDLTSPLIK